MTEKELQANIERLEELDVVVTKCSDGYELESYSCGGGDMFIHVDEPSKEEMLDYLDNFDINNEVLGWWEHGVPGPGVPFDNVRDHYNDVEEWVIRMKDIAEELEY